MQSLIGVKTDVVRTTISYRKNRLKYQIFKVFDGFKEVSDVKLG